MVAMAAESPSSKPPTAVQLVWTHDLVLSGTSGDVTMTLDSASHEGPSPVQALAFALAGCMAMDVIHVLRKGRHDLRGLKAELAARRMATDPKRLSHITLHYTLTGDIPPEPIERAIQLSREKYCSVWHSMRHDVEFGITFVVSPLPA